MKKTVVALCFYLSFGATCHATMFLTPATIKNIPAYMGASRERPGYKKNVKQDEETKKVFQQWQRWQDHSKDGFRRFVYEKKIGSEHALMILEFEKGLNNLKD